MKNIIIMLCFYLFAPVLLAQTNKKVSPVSASVLFKLRKAVEKTPDAPEAHKAYIAGMGIENPELKKQYEIWLKRYPANAVIPLSIGRMYYKREMPEATPFLLKAAELNPKDAKIWHMLWIDAQRWGNLPKTLEYITKATVAVPTNIEYACAHAGAYKDVDIEKYKKMTLALIRKFPDSPMVAASISMMGYSASSLEEKISIYESMRSMFPDSNIYKAVAMSRLNEAYIVRDQPEKAMELAGSMLKYTDFDYLMFREMHVFASKLVDLKKALKAGKITEAHRMLPAVNALNGSSKKRFEIGNYLVLLNASILNTIGASEAAYDTLLVYQSRMPDDEVGKALCKYGCELGKDTAQIQLELQTAIYKSARPCPDFDLSLYASANKIKLADLKGKVTLLTFWFPGCGPCRGELPYFQKVVNKYKDLYYLGVNVMPAQDEYVLSFIKGTGYTFTPLRGEWKWARKKFGINGAPSNFILDKDGKIVYSDFMIEEGDTRRLELMIESLM